jgi:hypothetical protein
LAADYQVKGETVITEIKTDGIEAAMAVLEGARNARAAVREKIGAVDAELRVLDTDLGSAREELRKEETRIAISGSPLPNEPFPVEARIASIERHQRILRTRRGIFEQQELQPAEEQVRAAAAEVQNAWRLLGMQQTERLRAVYREAASTLRAAYIEYVLWTWEFSREEDARDFPRVRNCPSVFDLVGHDALMNPLYLNKREYLEAQCPDWVARVQAIKADVSTAKQA